MKTKSRNYDRTLTQRSINVVYVKVVVFGGVRF